MNCLPGESRANWILTGELHQQRLPPIFAANARFRGGTHHHLHADLSIDAVHEDVTVIQSVQGFGRKSNHGNLQFIEAPYWRPHGLPH